MKNSVIAFITSVLLATNIAPYSSNNTLSNSSEVVDITNSYSDNGVYEYNGFKYIINENDKVEIIGGNFENEIELRVPSYIDDMRVVSINDNAFEGLCVSRIYISDDIKIIGNNAFKDSSVQHVYISNNLTSLGNGAFEGCKNLTSITLPGTLTKISSNAFKDCIQLREIYIEDGIEGIESNAFSGCNRLNFMIIPNTVIYIDDDAFSGTNNIKYINYSGTNVGIFDNLKYKAIKYCYNSKKVSRSTSFELGRDNWRFNNRAVSCFDSLGDEKKSILSDTLLDVEYNELLNGGVDKRFDGVCKSLTILSMLTCAGILDPADLQEGASCLHDVELTDDVLSTTSYYQLLGANLLEYNSLREFNIKEVEKHIKSGEPVAVSFYFLKDESTTSHMVLGYGIEEGNYEIDGDTYSHRMLIYDNNDSGGKHYIYYNEDSDDILLPQYRGYSSGTKWRVYFTLDDIDLFNSKGFINNSRIKEYSGNIDVETTPTSTTTSSTSNTTTTTTTTTTGATTATVNTSEESIMTTTTSTTEKPHSTVTDVELVSKETTTTTSTSFYIIKAGDERNSKGSLQDLIRKTVKNNQ